MGLSKSILMDLRPMPQQFAGDCSDLKDERVKQHGHGLLLARAIWDEA